MNKKLPWDIIIARFKGISLSEDEQTQLQEWLNQDVANQQFFNELQNLWNQIQTKAAGYNPDVDFYWKKFQTYIHQDSIQTKPEKVKKIVPRWASGRVLRRFAAAIGLLLVVSGTGYLFFESSHHAKHEAIAQTYSTITGKSKFILPDGSEVWLNANSELEYTNLHADVREVTLKGEAFFHVQHDRKPFIVKTNDIAVKVHGTQFNVSAYDDDDKSVVSLYEGSVSMHVLGDDEPDHYLKPGEEGSLDKKSKTISVEEGDVEFAMMWTKDRVKLENKNLHEVCRYLSKWYNVKIEIDPALSDDQSYTFTLYDQSLEDIVRIMASISSIHYHFDENNTLIITP